MTETGDAGDAGPTATAPVLLAEAPLFIVTRFSYLGKSGWKSDASRDAELLFSEDRLRQRIGLFRSICLPSLAAQTDQNFTHLILTSKLLPAWAMTELTAACKAAYGRGGRFSILPKRPGVAGVALRQHFRKVGVGPLVASAVLDDDDGLSVDFVQDVREVLARRDAGAGPGGPRPKTFISFARGYGFQIDGQSSDSRTASIYTHRYPYINCGLTMVASPEEANILAIQHRKTPLLHDPILIDGKRMFVRSVHGTNDSRVAPTDRWKPVANWRDDPDIRARFPWLLDDGASWNLG